MHHEESPDLVTEVMSRIREEVAARRSEGQEGEAEAAAQAACAAASSHGNRVLCEPLRLPRLGAAADPFPDPDRGLHVFDFLRLDDDALVQIAYELVAGRAPTTDEHGYYVGCLQQGSRTAVEVLGELRYGDVGRQRGVHIRGLWSRWQLARIGRKAPWVAGILMWPADLAKLPSRIAALRQEDDRLRRQMKAREQHLESLRELIEGSLNAIADRVDDRLSPLEQSLARAADDLQRQSSKMASFERYLDTETGTVEYLHQQVLELREAVDRGVSGSKTMTAIQDLGAQMESLTSKLGSLDTVPTTLEDLGNALSRLDETVADLMERVNRRKTWMSGVEMTTAELQERLDQLREAVLEARHRAERVESQVDHANGRMDRFVEQVGEHKGRLELLASFRNEDRALVDILIKLTNDFKARFEAVDSARTDLENQLRGILDEASGLRGTVDANTRLASEVAAAVQHLEAQGYDHTINLLDQERRLRLLLEEARRRLPEPLDQTQLERIVDEHPHLLDPQYVSFTERFRGTREDVKRRQSVYLPRFKTLEVDLRAYPVLDVGCGRGEWLELLKKNRIPARGLDFNRVMVDQCRELGLDAEVGDAIGYLRELPEGSVGAVTSFHLVEHLEHEALREFLDQSFRALQSGGMLLLETPNPRNLIVGASTFYLDPTHRNPLHPATLQYLVEARGFCRTEIVELNPAHESLRLPDSSPLAQRLNQLLFGPQDYAVIGYKV